MPGGESPTPAGGLTPTPGRLVPVVRGCCSPYSINGTPDVDEHEAEKIRRKMRRHDASVAARQEEEGA